MVGFGKSGISKGKTNRLCSFTKPGSCHSLSEAPLAELIADLFAAFTFVMSELESTNPTGETPVTEPFASAEDYKQKADTLEASLSRIEGRKDKEQWLAEWFQSFESPVTVVQYQHKGARICFTRN